MLSMLYGASSTSSKKRIAPSNFGESSAPSEVEISVRQPPSRGPDARPGTTTEAAVSAGSREIVTGAVVITALRSASADSGPVRASLQLTMGP
jgi:hypothetical protein